MKSKLEYLMNSLDQIKVGNEFDSAIEEVQLLVPEITEQLCQAGNILKVTQKVTDARTFNISSLERALELMEKSPPNNFKIERTGKTIDVQELLSKLKDHVAIIKKNLADFGPLEIGLRVELNLNSDFEYLLMSYPKDAAPAKAMRTLVKEKVHLFDEYNLRLIWARFKGQFEGGRFEGALIAYDDILGKTFSSEINSLEQLQNGIVDFVCTQRPQIVRRMLEDESVQGIRVPPVGIAGLLGMHRLMEPVSNLDFLIIYSMTEIIALTEKLTHLTPSNFARGLGYSPDLGIFDGELLDRAKKAITKINSREELFSKLKATLIKAQHYVMSASKSPSDLEVLLRRYKLGKEIMAPRETESIKKGPTKEIDLQVEVCRFLVERGIRCFGKSFGRAQLDLYASEPPANEVVIEAKVYRTSPSENLIKSNFVQLLSYMDQELHHQPRGVLVLFNCSDTLIQAPRQWLGNRVLVVPINIGELPPSGRRARIEIQNGDEPQKILVVSDRNKPVRSSSKRFSRKKKRSTK